MPGVTVPNDGKLTESLSSQIFERLIFSHVATSYSSVVRGLDIGVSSSRHFSKKAPEMQEAFA